MKKFASLLFAAALVLGVTATASAQVRFGVKAGLNLANVMFDGEDDQDTKMLPSFHAGGVLEFGLTEMVGLSAGLQVSGKGFKISEDDFEAKSNPIYLQVPLAVYYQSSGLYIGAGPYVGFGLFGKNKVEILGEEEDEDISFGSSADDEYAPLDFGIGAELGYNINALRVSASYNFGLANLIPDDGREDDKANHSVIGVSLAYFFGASE
jgi:hypothetical protein